MKKAAAFLFLLAGAASPQDPAPPAGFSEARIRQLIEQLADEDVARREEATAALQRAGGQARKQLEEAARSPNLERAGRADRLLWALHPLRVSIKVQDAGPVSKEKPVPAELRLRHPGPDTGVYLESGFKVTVWLVEPSEEPPQEGRRIHGSFGGRASSGCNLSESDFLRLDPGSEHSIRIDDLRTHWGFQIAKTVVEKYPKISLEAPTLAGRYKLVATYGYDRAKYIEGCTKGCRGHSKTEAAWNLSSDRPLQAEAEFVIR